MGGMAAQIPIKDDPAANQVAAEKVFIDSLAWTHVFDYLQARENIYVDTIYRI